VDESLIIAEAKQNNALQKMKKAKMIGISKNKHTVHKNTIKSLLFVVSSTEAPEKQ